MLTISSDRQLFAANTKYKEAFSPADWSFVFPPASPPTVTETELTQTLAAVQKQLQQQQTVNRELLEQLALLNARLDLVAKPPPTPAAAPAAPTTAPAPAAATPAKSKQPVKKPSPKP